MKALVASILLIATSIGLSSAVGAGAPPDRPPGVASSDWVPLSSSLGLVLVHPRRVGTIPDATVLLLAPPAEGYLMVKRASGWVRVVIVDPLRGPGVSG